MSTAPSASGGNPTSYDEVPYPSTSFPETHPNRLAAIARLFGVAAVPPSLAQVLELGCSDGGNLLPMAAMAPGASFLGIDASKVQIAAGQRTLAATQLRNVTLRHQDIMTFSAEEGVFDYILVHGVYSWVPHPVREKILAIVGTQLAPNGVALISYNALPAAYPRLAIRDMARFHTQKISDPWQRIRSARKFLNFVAESVAAHPHALGTAALAELQRLPGTDDSYVRHELLEDENTAVYFHEFMAQASRHGLQYLGDTHLSQMLPSNFPPKARQELEKIGDLVAQQQYMDFLRHHPFRQTLLCRSTVSIQRRIAPTAMRNLVFQALFQPPAGPVELQEGVALRFALKEGRWFDVSRTFTKAACMILCATPARVMAFDALVAAARELSGRASRPLDAARTAMEERSLESDLLSLYSTGYLELYAEAIQMSITAPDMPLATAVARHQARQGQKITNRIHQPVPVGDMVGHVIAVCDGTNSRVAILDGLLHKVRAGVLLVQEGGQTLTHSPKLKEVLAVQLDHALAELARHGMFA